MVEQNTPCLGNRAITRRVGVCLRPSAYLPILTLPDSPAPRFPGPCNPDLSRHYFEDTNVIKDRIWKETVIQGERERERE